METIKAKIHLISDLESDTICGIDKEVAAHEDAVTHKMHLVTCKDCLGEIEYSEQIRYGY